MSIPLRKLLALLKPWLPWFVLVTLIAFGTGWAEQQIPVQIRAIINASLVKRDTLAVHHGILLVCLLSGGAIVLRIGQRLATEWPATRIGANLFQFGLQHLLSRPFSDFKQDHSSAAQVRITRSTAAIVDLIKIGFSDFLPPLFGLVLAEQLLWITYRPVGVFTGAVVLLLAGCTVWQMSNQKGIRAEISNAREEQGICVGEAISGIEQVKLFRAEDAEANRTKTAVQALSDREYGHHCWMALFDLVKLTMEAGGGVVVLFCALSVASHPGSRLGIGGVMMLTLLYARVTDPVRHLHRILDQFGEKWSEAKNYLDILEITPVTRVTAVPFRTSRSAPKDIVFQDVSFVYPRRDEPALDNVSLHIPHGNKTALVGHTASGKSTLARLITGVYMPTEGRILIGGVPTEPVESSNQETRVGMLTQESFIFKGTVAENIRYGLPGAMQEELEEAARIAGLHEELVDTKQFPNGYETMLNENGGGLSGGQKQRLALARVILSDPDIIVFDEPSSALDPSFARRFFDEVLQTFRDKTLVVISHDLSNLHWADHIVVMEGGRIAEDGDWEDLCLSGTLFSRLRNGHRLPDLT